MTPEEFETAYVPVPIRWRHIVAGDVFVGQHGALWTVVEIRTHNVSPENGYPHGMLGVRATNGGATRFEPSVDPDEAMHVLTPVPMAQAVALTRAELGMQLIERRDDAAGTGAVA